MDLESILLESIAFITMLTFLYKIVDQKKWFLLPLVYPSSLFWYVTLPCVLYFMGKKGPNLWTEHAAQLASEIPLKEATSIGEQIFNSIRDIQGKLFDNYKFFKVAQVDKRPGDISNGCHRMRCLLAESPIGEVGDAVELGAGRGGWTQTMRPLVKGHFKSISRWNQPGQEDRWIDIEGVDYQAIDAQHLQPRKVDLLLSDMGESDRMDTYMKQVVHTMEILKITGKWLKLKPKYFYIRIPNPLHDDVLEKIQKLKDIVGTGKLVRLASERNSVATVYFTHGDGDIYREAEALSNILLSRLNSEDEWVNRDDEKGRHREPFWEHIPQLPVPKLEMLDMKRCLLKGLRPPLKVTEFLKELGWVPSNFEGSSSTVWNSYVIGIIKGLELPGFGTWQTTSTTPAATYRTVMDKIDRAPRENHKHYNRMWAAYKAISKFLRARGHKLRRLNGSEIMTSINKHGAMGRHDSDLPFANLGEYAMRPDVWKPRVELFKKNLLEGHPIWADYESIGKKERKNKDSSRLIWYMSATARLYEAELFGHYDALLKALPQSVSGVPLYDYGDILSEIMKPGMYAVCDDVAGWDTRVSAGIQSLENAYLQTLTDDPELKKEIGEMYRLYAYPMVSITRPTKGGGTQLVQYRLQGQVASGRRVTYGMNTTTNIVVTACRAAYAYGIPEEEMEDWFFKQLCKGHTKCYGGKISGDDSAIILDYEHAHMFAHKGAEFMNEIGMKRKNVPEQMPSQVLSSMDKIDFCSHNYTEVTFNNGKQQHKKWMPIRSITEILAKAAISSDYLMSEQKAAWARAQGLNLLVNYFHLATARMVAYAILSATPENIDMSCAKKGWKYRATPWIREGNVVDIVNGCLFGDSSTRPVDFRIGNTDQLPYVGRFKRREYDTKFTTCKYQAWKKSIPQRTEQIKLMNPPHWKYTNWLPKAMFKDIESEGSPKAEFASVFSLF